MPQWIETHDQTLVEASAVEAINPVTRQTKVAGSHEVLLATANHSYVFARGFDSHDDAVKVARQLAGEIGTGADGRKFALDLKTKKIVTRFLD